MKNLLCVLTLLSCLASTATVSAESLAVFIEQSSSSLIQEVDESRLGFDMDPTPLYARVDEILGGLVDFPVITRGVMGRHYAGASEQQHGQFQMAFRRTIVELLSKTLVLLESNEIKVLPIDQKKENRATAVMNVNTSGGKVYKLIYSMAKVGDVWKVRNIIVDGINLGIVYRNQFNSAMGRQENNIDAVIQSWNINPS